MLVCFRACWCGIASSELAAVLLLGLRMVVPDVLRLLHVYSQTNSFVWLVFLVVWVFIYLFSFLAFPEVRGFCVVVCSVLLVVTCYLRVRK